MTQSVQKYNTRNIPCGCYRFEDTIARVARWLDEYYCAIEWPAIIFVAQKVEGEELVHALRHAGLAVALVTGDVPEGERAEIKAGLSAGKWTAAVATDAWSTGLDIPELKSVVRTAGGSAPIGLKQQSGRGTRLADDKQSFTIWDLVKPNDKHLEARVAAYQDGGYEVVGLPPRREPGPAQGALPPDHNLNQLLDRPRPLHPSRRIPCAGLTPTDQELRGWRHPFIGTGGPFMSWGEGTAVFFVVAILLIIALASVCS